MNRRFDEKAHLAQIRVAYSRLRQNADPFTPTQIRANAAKHFQGGVGSWYCPAAAQSAIVPQTTKGKTQMNLTTSERLLFQHLPRDPNSGTTIAATAKAVAFSRSHTGSILSSLADKGLVGHSSQKIRRTWWRLYDAVPSTTQIQGGKSLDDAISSLTNAAANCHRYQEALLAIGKILADTGLFPQLSGDAE